MKKKTVTFRLDSRKARALDAVASILDRDRSYVLNEAVASYLAVHEWQTAHIKEGLRQADAGKFAAASEAASTFARRRR